MSLSISLSAEQVEQRLVRIGIPCAFTPDERLKFSTTPIVSGENRTFGFPTPAVNSRLTLASLKDCVGTSPSQQPSFFDHPWYASEAFMNASCPPGWHFLSMDVMAESLNQSADYCRRFRSVQMELPMAIEVVLMLFLHYADTKEQLLLRKHTWCSDLASLGRQVTVGAFGRNGVFLSGHPTGFTSRGLGVCAKFRL